MSKLSRRAFGRQLLAGVTAGCAALPGQHPNAAAPVTCPARRSLPSDHETSGVELLLDMSALSAPADR